MRAVITGANGQDGQLLQEYLRQRSYELICVDVGNTHFDRPNNIDRVDICSEISVAKLVEAFQPDEIYHLAVLHHSAEEKPVEGLRLYRDSYEVNFFSLLHFLEAIRIFSPRTCLFYAASSHIFGAPPAGCLEVHNESTPLKPQSLYAMTKADGLLACREFRQKYGIRASTGILFNHESQYRSVNFLSKKVVRTAIDIKLGRARKLVLGDLDGKVDWGYAPDYVEAMHLILSLAPPSEYVIATGLAHTVSEFVEAVFDELDIPNWSDFVMVDSARLGRRQGNATGDYSKLNEATAWKPRTAFREMIKKLVAFETTRQGIRRKE